MQHRDLIVGMVRLHILHHAVEGTIYGQEIIEELGRHGYRVSAGTIYPLLHSMERKGYLRSDHSDRNGRAVRMYRATPAGRKALHEAKGFIRELFDELVGDG